MNRFLLPGIIPIMLLPFGTRVESNTLCHIQICDKAETILAPSLENHSPNKNPYFLSYINNRSIRRELEYSNIPNSSQTNSRLASPTQVRLKNINQKNIIKILELALNSNNEESLKNIFSEKLFLGLLNKKEEFLNRFSNTNWSIKNSPKGENLLDIKITGERIVDEWVLSLESIQRLNFKISNNKIIDYSLELDSSILKTLENPLEVTIVAPDEVLTGSRYDIDIILEEPLGENFVAAGLINVSNKDIKSPYINLMPISSGGLFKSIQAPLNEGKQTIAALIVHPKGIISVTKVINIISDSDQSNLLL